MKDQQSQTCWTKMYIEEFFHRTFFMERAFTELLVLYNCNVIVIANIYGAFTKYLC